MTVLQLFSLKWVVTLPGLLHSHPSRSVLYFSPMLSPGLVGFWEGDSSEWKSLRRSNTYDKKGQSRIGQGSCQTVWQTWQRCQPNVGIGEMPAHSVLWKGPMLVEMAGYFYLHLAQLLTKGHPKRNVNLAQKLRQIPKKLAARGYQPTTALSDGRQVISWRGLSSPFPGLHRSHFLNPVFSSLLFTLSFWWNTFSVVH